MLDEHPRPLTAPQRFYPPCHLGNNIERRCGVRLDHTSDPETDEGPPSADLQAYAKSPGSVLEGELTPLQHLADRVSNCRILQAT